MIYKKINTTLKSSFGCIFTAACVLFILLFFKFWVHKPLNWTVNWSFNGWKNVVLRSTQAFSFRCFEIVLTLFCPFRLLYGLMQLLIWHLLEISKKIVVSLLPRPLLVVVVAVVFVNLSHARLLLKNHLTNFNQTWIKLTLVKENSSLFRIALFQGVMITKLRKCSDEIYIISFSRTTTTILIKLSTKHPWV